MFVHGFITPKEVYTTDRLSKVIYCWIWSRNVDVNQTIKSSQTSMKYCWLVAKTGIVGIVFDIFYYSCFVLICKGYSIFTKKLAFIKPHIKRLLKSAKQHICFTLHPKLKLLPHKNSHCRVSSGTHLKGIAEL